MNKKFSFFILIILWFFIGVFQSKAATGNTITACPDGGGCTFSGGEGVQKAVDSAKDGDTILIKGGRYTRSTFTPVKENYSHGQCFINTNEKSITINGEGNTLFDGQNDEFGTGVKDLFRAGICITGGTVTVDNISVKQFLGPGMVMMGSQVIVKNVFFIDIDNQVIIIHPNVNALLVNNFFSSNGPIRVGANTNVTIVNNTFSGNAAVSLNLCKEPYPNASIINNVATGVREGGGIIMDCPENRAKFTTLKASNNLIWKGFGDGKEGDQNVDTSCYANEICNTLNEIVSSPLLNNPIIYGDVGWAGWTDFHPQEGSPIIGVGDTTIPGIRQLGMYGGPCVEPNSSICSSFVQSHFPKPVAEPSPLETDLTSNSIDNTVQVVQNKEPLIPDLTKTDTTSTTNETIKRKSLSNNMFFEKKGTLYIGNTGTNKKIQLLEISLQNDNQKINTELSVGNSFQYDYSNQCKDVSSKLSGGFLYSSSDDNFASVRYKNLEVDCSKTEVIEIQ